MKLTYDPYADALYLFHKRNQKTSRSEVVSDDVIIDFDKQGKLLGMEILSASKQFSKRELKSVNFEINLEKPTVQLSSSN